MSKQMMRIMMAVALVSGLIVAVGIYRILGSRSTGPATVSVPVVLAKASIQAGSELNEAKLRVETRPMLEAPQGALAAVQLAQGRIARTDIPTGTIITETLLVPPTQSPIRALLKAGFRAIGVFVDARGAIQRMVQTGDRVDVIVTMEDEQNVSSSRVLLQDVEVLMVPPQEKSEDLTYSAPERGSEWLPVTLAVRPADAEKLSLAMRVGSIQLMLRGYDDAVKPETSGVTRDTLLPAVMNPPVASKGAATTPSETTFSQVELIKGQERNRERFLQGPNDRNTPLPSLPGAKAPISRGDS